MVFQAAYCDDVRLSSEGTREQQQQPASRLGPGWPWLRPRRPHITHLSRGWHHVAGDDAQEADEEAGLGQGGGGGGAGGGRHGGGRGDSPGEHTLTPGG